MTVIELFKTKTIDEIAQTFADLHYNFTDGCRKWNVNVSDTIDLDDSMDCPDECNELEHGSYEDAWMEGLCALCPNEKCKYGIDRKIVWKNEFINWLNQSIEQS